MAAFVRCKTLKALYEKDMIPNGVYDKRNKEAHAAPNLFIFWLSNREKGKRLPKLQYKYIES